MTDRNRSERLYDDLRHVASLASRCSMCTGAREVAGDARYCDLHRARRRKIIAKFDR